MNNKATVTWTDVPLEANKVIAPDLICHQHYLKRSGDYTKNGKPYVALVQYDDLGPECIDCAMELDV